MISCAASFAEPAAEQPPCGETSFLKLLFRLLDRHDVHYCVLHSWDGLPEMLESDLDIAVDPESRKKLPLVFSALGGSGYPLLQVIENFVDAYCFRFGWIADGTPHTVSLDVIFGRQIGPFRHPTARQLVAKRRRHRGFWTASPEMEFLFLLARRVSKASASAEQAGRIAALARELGREQAEVLAGHLFVGRMRRRIVEACLDGNLAAVLPSARQHGQTAAWLRDPLGVARDSVADVARRWRRWRRPTGLFLAVMGPDGVGKSTLLDGLTRTLDGCFGRITRFHWRPMLVLPARRSSDTTRPHAPSPDGRIHSLVRLAIHLADFCAGYWLRIRPLLGRSGLVLFDRYFYDLPLDPQRYRYSGPAWVARCVGFAVPAPDQILVLDAPESVALGRKREIEQAAMRRLRAAYSAFAESHENCRRIDASQPADRVTAEAVRIIFDFLESRVQRHHRRWLASD